MRKAICLSLAIVHLIFVSGCATAPDKISASYVSPMQYYGFDCDQIQQEMLRVSSKVREVAGVQKGKANGDAWAMGVGLIIFWPALFFLMGGDKKEEIARLKGEYDALEQASIQKKCAFMDDVEKARAEAKAKKDVEEQANKDIAEKKNTELKAEPSMNFKK